MARKISQKDFLKRFYKINSKEQIEVIEYTAISNKCIIKCKLCGRVYTKARAREFFSSFKCCDKSDLTKYEKLLQIYKNSSDFKLIKKINKDEIIVYHSKCKNEQKRTIQSAMDNPFSCKNCETHKKTNSLTSEEAQLQIYNKGIDNITLLEYNGQLNKNKYRCLKCGFIFTQQHTCLLQSKGCPKCDKKMSLGEKQIRKLLIDNNITFDEQIRFKDLPLQSFDFGVYNDNKLLYLIEVQGDQHYKENTLFSDTLQERNNRKRQYCIKNKIPLYELIYIKGKIKNLEILPL